MAILGLLRFARNDAFRHCEAGGRGSPGLLRFARNDSSLLRFARNDRAQLCQGLKRTPRLSAEFGFQRTQVAAHAQLAAMLVHHFKVHEKVGAQHVELEVVALHIQAGFITNFFQQHIGQAARTKQLGG